MRLLFTPGGRTQFLAAIEYILRDNQPAASKFRRKAERTLRRLLRFPDSGRLITEFPELPFREVIVSPYRFFYRVVGGTVWIVATWHGAQSPDAPETKADVADS